MKKLYKSNDNKMITGRIGGLGEHFDIDPALLRVVWLVLLIFTGLLPGIAIYFTASVLVPRRPIHIDL